MSDYRKLDPDNMPDPGSQQHVRVLKSLLLEEPLVNCSFKHIDQSFTAAGTFTVAHGLGFQPLDVIQTWLSGAGSLTWNYTLFDKTYLSVTTTGACRVRAFIGAYRGI